MLSESVPPDEAPEEALLEELEQPDDVPGFSERRIALVRRAVRQWTDDLIDLGGRNNLLAYRELKRGTLDLTDCSATALDGLLRGRPIRISSLFPNSGDPDKPILRARTIFKKARENFDERGIETLTLACGLAKWANSKGSWQPRAPVVLRRALLKPIGLAQDDFELTLLEGVEVSPTLLHILRTDFGCDLDEEGVLYQVESVVDELWKLDTVYERLSDNCKTVPSFAIEKRLVLANFAYTKLPMVRDLQQSFDELVAHDLIAAIAGDEEARTAMAAKLPDPQTIVRPDQVAPRDEYLVLDADSSQNFAINAALAGANLIVRGPPGTGKSQTIANLIASLSAHGKKVLFVAEKRAAIDAVLKRLRQTNLGDLIIDLHGGVASRREFAQLLATSLDSIGGVPRVENDDHLRRLTKYRDALIQYEEALHKIREPWGVTLYEARHKLLSLAGYENNIKFRGKALANLSADVANEIESYIEEFLSLGGREWPSTPWSNSPVATSEEVEISFDLVSDIQNEYLPRFSELVSSATSETGITDPQNLNEWSPRLDLLKQVAEIHSVLRDDIFSLDLEDVCSKLAPAGRGSFSRIRASLFSVDYRRSRALIRGLLVKGRSEDKDLLTWCERAKDAQATWRRLATGSRVVAPARLTELVQSYEALMDQLEEAEVRTGTSDLCDLSQETLESRLDDLLAQRNVLVNLPRLKELTGVLKDLGVQAILDSIPQCSRDCAKCFRFSWLRSVVDHVSLDPAIGGFAAESHYQTVERFQSSDRSHIDTTPDRIRRIWASHAVESRDKNPQQDEVIKHQARLKRRHMPIRELIRTSTDVLQALKPCWVMSPLVVSQLLPPQMCFDVVIFDEASQITPADAIPAIMRGRQLVVAGDRKQLPPTAFFVAESAEDENEEQDENVEQPVLSGMRGFESILDSLPEALFHWRMLEWHYRSRDERLIAFSNAHIYDRMLTTFPGSGYPRVLAHKLAPQDPGGETNSPGREVSWVVDLVIEHFREHPGESLGVIAMGIKHANRIEEALRIRLSEDPTLEREFGGFLGEDQEERFFVKNLERVQGDERDAIILSIGYGKTASGSLPYRFGPLLQEGGERRLNVAITRAKKRMTLVSSFNSRDMDPEKSSAPGVGLLRQFLQYMETGGEYLGDRAAEKPSLNAFEVDVKDTLEEKGLSLIPQYGTSGYWIDFAVRHPERPGEFVLALECDGASYHSSKSSRDRDRLRQEQLERLGWRFHRIWSTEWFYRKDQAVAKVLDSYAEAISVDTSPLAGRGQPRDNCGTTSPPVRSTSRPRLPRRSLITEYTESELVRLIQWIESDGKLRTEQELIDEVVGELGFQRRGPRIMESIQKAIRRLRERQLS